MPRESRKLAKGSRTELALGVDPIVLLSDPSLCHGNFPNFYIAGIDFVCDGSASRRPVSHSSVTLRSFRHFTCERADDNEAWEVGATFRGRETNSKGELLDRVTFECPKCTFELSLKSGTIESLMAGHYQEHNRRVERRNVSTLLN